MSRALRSMIAVAICGICVSDVSAQKPGRSLDADIVTSYKLANGQIISTTGHYYRSASGQTREDSDLGAVIVDTKTRTVTILNHARKEARIFTPREASQTLASRPKPSDLTPLGRGSVEGHDVTKSSVTGSRGETHEVWTAQDIGLVVFSKIKSTSTTTTRTLRNIALREPDSSMFAVPAGYSVTRMTSPQPIDPLTSTNLPPVGKPGRGGRGGTENRW